LVIGLQDDLEQSAQAGETVDLDQPIGRLSRMDAMQQQKMVQAQRERIKLRLGQVRGALASFERDEYGDCRGCEEPIAYKRLKARPEATLCIECRSQAEQR
jgi:DnaK suppressor protein